MIWCEHCSSPLSLSDLYCDECEYTVDGRFEEIIRGLEEYDFDVLVGKWSIKFQKWGRTVFSVSITSVDTIDIHPASPPFSKETRMQSRHFNCSPEEAVEILSKWHKQHLKVRDES